MAAGDREAESTSCAEEPAEICEAHRLLLQLQTCPRALRFMQRAPTRGLDSVDRRHVSVVDLCCRKEIGTRVIGPAETPCEAAAQRQYPSLWAGFPCSYRRFSSDQIR